MLRTDIDKLLSGDSDEATEAHTEIVAMQYSEDALLKTGHAYLDPKLIGGLNNKMVFIGSRPSMGKTHNCQKTINNLLNEEVNPGQAIKILRMNLEMTTQALLLRELKDALGKNMTTILSQPYSDAEKLIVKQVVKRFRDKRVINFSQLVADSDLRYTLTKFTELVAEEDEKRKEEKGIDVKTKKIVLVDHLHIYSSKEQIDSVLDIFNAFKMQDKNISFIIYFQFNRDTENMWRESKEKKVNPRYMLPHSGHIYMTDKLMQYADVVLGLVIPQVMELEQFVAVYKDKNQHLSEHFIPDTSQGSFVRLKGWNRIYYNYVKIRMVDSFDDPRLYCEILSNNYEVEAAKRYVSPTEDLSAPVFTAVEKENYNTNAMIAAQGVEFDTPTFDDEEEPPF